MVRIYSEFNGIQVLENMNGKNLKFFNNNNGTNLKYTSNLHNISTNDNNGAFLMILSFIVRDYIHGKNTN